MQLPPRQKALALVGVLLGMLLAALDNTIVSTAGPTMQRALHIEAGLYVWITTSYLVASTVLVPVWGKLSDTLGRRRVLLAGIVIFLGGSVLCGVSQNATQLILFRALQGVGSASLFTSAFAILGDLYSSRERGKLNGFFGAVFGLSSVVGPLVGGFLTDNFGWHWCFFVNLPLGAIAVGFILAKMPPLLPRTDKVVRIDFAGAVALTVGLVPLLVALSLGRAVVRPGETGFLWSSLEELTLFGVSIVGIIAFFFIEKRSSDPIVDLRLFENAAFARGAAASFVAGMPFLGAVVFLPLFMQVVVGERATGAGLATLPLTFGIVVSNIASGIATSRTGKYKPFLVASIAWTALSFAILALLLDVEATKLSVSWKMFLIGLGLGPAIPLFALAIQNAVPPQFIGVASSMATFSRQMGATIGVAVLGTAFATTLSDELATKMEEATRDIPAQMKAQFQAQQSAAPSDDEAAGEGPAAPAGFDRVGIEGKIHAAFAVQRDLVTRAIKDADPAAMAALANDPRVDARLSEAMSKGGIGAAVQAGFDATLARVKAALDAGPAALQALAADPALPPPLAERLKAIPPQALQSPQAKAEIVRGLEVGMLGAAAAAKQQAIDAALAGATGGLAKAEATAIEATGKMERAFKESFTDAVKRVYGVAFFMAMLALLAVLPMPVLALRQAPGAAAPSE